MSSDPASEMTPTIGDLPWWDLAEVAEHDAAVFGPTAWTLAYYWTVKAQTGTAMLAARSASAGELLGWVVMSAGGAEADVMTIATTAVGRGRGVGRSLLRAGIDWARGKRAEVVHLEVDERNSAAKSLYSAIGFEEWGRREGYYPGADAVLMRLHLRD